jgi:hypothetical protein
MTFWLYVILLSLHLAAMNVAGGAPLASVWLEWRERRAGAVTTAAADYLAAAALLSLLTGIVLGLGLIGLRWSPTFVELWSGPMARKMYWGLGELVFSLVLAGGYWAWRSRVRKPGPFARAGRVFLPLLSGTNLLYHFPALFLVASHLSEEGLTSGPSLTAREFRQQMMAGPTPALTVHVVLASIAAAGIALLGLALRWQRQNHDAEERKRLTTGAARLALVPTVLQILVGLWILVKVEPLTQNQLLGGNLPAAVCFLAGVLVALWLMQLLASLAFGEVERRVIIKSMAAFLGTILLMTAAWHAARAKPLHSSAHRLRVLAARQIGKTLDAKQAQKPRGGAVAGLLGGVGRPLHREQVAAHELSEHAAAWTTTQLLHFVRGDRLVISDDRQHIHRRLIEPRFPDSAIELLANGAEFGS